MQVTFHGQMTGQQVVIEAPRDPFYSKSNLEQLDRSIAQMESGKTIIKTMEELEAMEGE